jgi:hypothetical protein
MTLGQIAYEAYCKFSDNKSLVSGQELPSWGNLNSRIKAAWETCAKEVGRYVMTELTDLAKEN